jgi:phytoene dehydrogenase-like protein
MALAGAGLITRSSGGEAARTSAEAADRRRLGYTCGVTAPPVLVVGVVTTGWSRPATWPGRAVASWCRLPEDPPTYCFTPSTYDDGLAPAGRHTVYLACPSAPYDLRGGWETQAEAFADAMVEQVEQHAPGFRASIRARTVRTPTLMAQELRWPGAHPMHLDISLDQLAFLRPTRRLAGHRVPGVQGLFTCGASTAPVGGIAGSSGKAAALELLKG